MTKYLLAVGLYNQCLIEKLTGSHGDIIRRADEIITARDILEAESKMAQLDSQGEEYDVLFDGALMNTDYSNDLVSKLTSSGKRVGIDHYHIIDPFFESIQKRSCIKD